MTRTEETPANDKQRQAGWRVKLGFAIFIASIAWPVFIPVLPLLGVSGTAIAASSATMLVAAELMILAGAAIAGKDGFAVIKAKVFGFLKSYGPPEDVSRPRYMLGLVMFAIPIAFGLASPYLAHHIPGYETRPLIYAIGFDVMLLISLFVLGGAFWEKLRSLFYHDAYAVIPEAHTP